jgi:hypothetical protein
MHLRSFDLTQLNFAAKLQIKSVGSGIWGNKNNMERLFVLNTNGHKLYMKSFFVPECEMKLRIKRITRMSCLNTAAKAANVYEFGLGHSYPYATKLHNPICKDSSYSCHS